MQNKKCFVRFLLVFALIYMSQYLLYSQNSKFSKRLPEKDRFSRQNLLNASFCYYPVIPKEGQEIKFYNQSVGDPEVWCWSFGDGQLSNDKNPRHIYGQANIYLVTLRVERDKKISQKGVVILVKSSSGYSAVSPKANFMFEPENPQVGVPLRFYDMSTGNPTKWTWQFGYFDFSLLREPVKTFFHEGEYKVTLAVANESGSDKITKNIKVASPAANTIIAKSCSQKDVQAAISKANPGDMVVVPPGNAIWSSNLVINKAIILKGAGIDKTVVSCSYEGTSEITSPSGYFITYEPGSPAQDYPFRLSGFTFNLNSIAKTGGLLLRNVTNYHQTKIRLDHTRWQNVADGRAIIWLYGYFWGVADNNYFDTPGNLRFYGLDTTTWANETFNFGSGNNFYMEDNYFRCHHGDYWYIEGAGRLVLRNNEIHLDVTDDYYPVVDVHGNQPNAWSSAMGFEGYNNTIYASYSNRFIDLRAGRVLCYNNSFNQTNGSTMIAAREEYYDSDNPPANAPDGQPQHVSDSYIFNNYQNRVILIKNFPYVQSQLFYSNEGYVPTEDVHFWKHNSSFEGVSGVGVGPLSKRPLSCIKEGVAWWSTDDDKLYRWRNANWELYYIPYAYPHPLRQLLSD